MAPADSGAAALSTPTPVEDDPDKSCFICLQTAAETPESVWVTPCPCSLDAHEDCMLQWIAEMEVNTNSNAGTHRRKIRCPVCNARIRTIEPRDKLVDLGDRFLAVYRNSTPALLGSMVSAMGVAGSSFYGFQSLSVFAGSADATEWLFRGMPDMTAGNNLDSLVDMAAGVTTAGDGWLGGHAWWAFRVFNKMVLLNLLGPSLLLHRVLPSLANLLALPVSLIYGATLVSRNHLPTWPPSPSWAMVAMPTVSIAYATAYYDLFGGLEKRLNRALRGRPEQDEPQELQAPPPAGAGGDANANANANDDQGPPADAPVGILARLRRIRWLLAELAGQHDGDREGAHDHNHDRVNDMGEEAIVLPDNLFDPANFAMEVNNANNNDGFIQVDIAIEEVEEDTDEEDDDGEERRNIDDEILPPRQVRDDDMNILGDVGREEDDAAVPPPDIPRLRAEPAAADIADALQADVMDGLPLAEVLAAQVADANGPVPVVAPVAPAAPPPANNNAGGGVYITDIIAAITSQLLLPQVSAAIGNVLFAVLPRPWVIPPPPEIPVSVAAISWWASMGAAKRPSAPPTSTGGTVRRGLLMEKWGRSLVGGLLWIVLRDAWSLYIKYRRVQTKKQRKIKNVDRKKRSEEGEGEATTTQA
ncbi:hypothetical protein Sste5346_006380 [Sporothrix stenoceras]|uniref:RING-CH-type domain-containing protein n=1 Tax=Sporothrix stenoceras TaxID=5173 RepID=A0ABR3Z0E3_9PEZI